MADRDSSSYWARRASRRNLLRGGVAASAGLGAWALAGCGDDDSSSSRPATAASTAPSSAATTAVTAAAASPTAQIRRGGDIVIVATAEPGSLDYHKQSSGTGSTTGFALAYSLLIHPDPLGKKGVVSLLPELAQSWQTPDKTTYIFKLNPAAKYQNVAPVNGRAVKAEDFVYSFQRQIAEKVNAATGLPGLAATGITAIDATTLQLKLETPNADFLTSLTSGYSRLVPRETVELKGDLLQGPIVGSGPWIFKNWERGVTQELVRNPDYWIPGQPYADSVKFPLVVDPAQQEAQFLAGKILDASAAQVSIGIPIKTLQALDKTKYQDHPSLPSAPVMVMFEQGKAPFDDVRRRRALGMSLDRDLINANVFDGLLIPDASAMALKQYLLPREEVTKLLPHSPTDAKALWDQAGGARPLTMPTYEAATSISTGQIVQANWKKDLAFEVTIQSINGPQLTGGIYNPANSNFAVACVAVGHLASPTAELTSFYSTGGGRNGGHLHDTMLDDLIAKQSQEFDEPARTALLYQIQRRILEQAYYISVGSLPTSRYFNTILQGVPEVLFGGAALPFETMWLKA